VLADDLNYWRAEGEVSADVQGVLKASVRGIDTIDADESRYLVPSSWNNVERYQMLTFVVISGILDTPVSEDP
jgi:hypothetical protein